MNSSKTSLSIYSPQLYILTTLPSLLLQEDSKKIVKVDIDEQEELATQYKIMSVPTLLVFKNGEVVDKSIGLLEALGMQGAININQAFGILFGDNIGTTTTAMISSIGASKNASSNDD